MPSMTRSYCKNTKLSKMGFSQKASCKAQGFIKRYGKSNKGKYVVSKKYKRSAKRSAKRSGKRSGTKKSGLKCWAGYRRVKGKKPGTKGSCVKI